MKNQAQSIFISIFFSIFLLSCYSTEVSDSENVNQEHIYQNYSIDINKETNSALAKAVFRFESWQGNTLNLSSPSSITINKETLHGEKEWLAGFVYRRSRIEANDNKYIFEFTNSENKTYRNSIIIEPISIANYASILDPNNANAIEWNGEKIGRNETVTVNLVMNDTIKASISTSLIGGKEVILKPTDLSKFSEGTANMWISRSITKNLDEATQAEGKLTGNYRSVTIPVTIGYANVVAK